MDVMAVLHRQSHQTGKIFGINQDVLLNRPHGMDHWILGLGL